jgi:hypothetical protein
VDVADDFTAAMGHKNPKQKLETLKILQVPLNALAKWQATHALLMLICLLMPGRRHSRFLLHSQECVQTSIKDAAAKSQSMLVPSLIAAANDASPTIRESAMHVLVTFVLKAGSMRTIEKVVARPVISMILSNHALPQ